MPNIKGATLPRNPPRCVECGERSFLHSHADGARWVCECGAYAHCKLDSLIPGARPCNDETRQARRDAHDACNNAALRTAKSPSSKHKWAAVQAARWRAAQHFGSSYKSFQFGWMTLDEARAAKAFFEGMT